MLYASHAYSSVTAITAAGSVSVGRLPSNQGADEDIVFAAPAVFVMAADVLTLALLPLRQLLYSVAVQSITVGRRLWREILEECERVVPPGSCFAQSGTDFRLAVFHGVHSSLSAGSGVIELWDGIEKGPAAGIRLWGWELKNS